jgi:hypothetical protein
LYVVFPVIVIVISAKFILYLWLPYLNIAKIILTMTRYRGSPTSTVSNSTNSTCTIFSAIDIKFVQVEFLELAM